MDLQEILALAIVGVVAFYYFQKLLRRNVVGPISQLLLKKGKINWAVKLNSFKL
jgi:hypothetical protein